ncbi:MAG: YraN family protein [Lachnospiraceae bacterium]|nr:YraN family protein [Lachnospiraceae bacterium]
MNNRQKGSLGEKMAEQYLIDCGVRILDRNFRSHEGEIDLIGRHGRYLVFFEVKSRKGSGKGLPEEAVGIRKQASICRVSDFYRTFHHISNSEYLRYDVVAISDGEIRWHQNAFPYHYRYNR